jgi:hypothetical protein
MDELRVIQRIARLNLVRCLLADRYILHRPPVAARVRQVSARLLAPILYLLASFGRKNFKFSENSKPEPRRRSGRFHAFNRNDRSIVRRTFLAEPDHE